MTYTAQSPNKGVWVLVFLIVAVCAAAAALTVPLDPCLVEFSVDPEVDEYVALHCGVR